MLFSRTSSGVLPIILINLCTILSAVLVFGNDLQEGRPQIPTVKVVSIKTQVFDENVGETELVENVDDREKEIALGEGGIPVWTLPFHLINQILQVKLHSVKIECSSATDLPKWDYNGYGVLPNIHVENSRSVDDYWNSTTYRYTSTLIISSFTEQLTGQYICQNAGDASMRNSFSLFSPRESHHPFNEGTVITTTKQEIRQTEIIPCRVANLSATFSLYEKNYDGELEAVFFIESLKFDPFVGFRIFDSEYVLRSLREQRYYCIDLSSNKSLNKPLLEIKIQENNEEDYDNEDSGSIPKFSVMKEGSSHIFTCRSNSSLVPNIIFLPLKTTGCLPSNFLESTNPFQIEEDCGEGCRQIRTNARSLSASCIGDDINEEIRVPPSSYCVGRPYLIQRGEVLTIYVAKRQKRVVVPCISNNHAADIYLYRESVQKNGAPNLVETDHFFYDPLQGFVLNTTILPYPCGTYICTSNLDLNDTSDIVRVQLHPDPVGVYEPKEKAVYALCPIRFKWRAKEQLIVVERKMGVSSFRYDFSYVYTYPYVGTFELLYPEETAGEIHLIKRRNGKLVHTWNYHCISNETEIASGLTANTIYDLSGDVGLTYISVKCQSKSQFRPEVFTSTYCNNKNSCWLAKKNSERIIKFTDSRPHSELREQESCGVGCTAIQFFAEARPQFPLQQVVCFGEGVNSDNQFAIVNLFATGESAIWDSNSNNGRRGALMLRLKSDSLSPWEGHPNLQWHIGETIMFECRSKETNGVQLTRNFLWAVQYENGTMQFIEVFQSNNCECVDGEEEQDGADLVGNIEFEIDDQHIKKLWCIAPLADSRDWINASYPLIIRNSNEDLLCDEKGLEMRLVRLFPFPENMVPLKDNRLDNLEYFVVPPNVTNLNIEVVSSEPIVWTFTSYWNRHEFTFKNRQSARTTLELFQNEITNQCYASTLLLEFDLWKVSRAFNTGLLSVFYVHEPWKKSSIYLYFPVDDSKVLLNSGISLSLPWNENEEFTKLPCLVNNPKATVSLFQKNVQGVFEKVNQEKVSFDPKIGFRIKTPHFNNFSSPFETFKCISDSKPKEEIEIKLVR